jgi:putative ABC transport system permease protein
MIWQNIKNALISIRSAKLRSFLTVMGVVIGVFAVLVMVAAGDGVKAQIGGQVSSLGTNVLTITSGKVGQSSTAKNGQQQKSSGLNLSSALGASTLTGIDLRTVEETKDVVKVSSFSIISTSVSRANLSSSTAVVVATDPNYFDIRSIKLSQGRAISDEDMERSNQVVVIGPDTKSNLFGDQDPIGQSISLRGKDYEVVGVTAKSDGGVSIGSSSDDIILLPSTSAELLLGKLDIYRIIAQVNDADNVDSVKASLEQSITQNHSGSNDFSVLTQEDLLSTFNSILDVLTAFVVAIAAISLLVGGIGIMNIMLVTVTERTREIGIRKALGATFGNIMGQFLMESIIISLIGGLLGLLLSYLAGFVIKELADITPVYSLKALVVALGVSLTIGIVFGTAPAVKAARKSPIQALKSL